MVLEDAPAAFDRVVLAVLGRGIRQPHREVILLHNIDEPLHTLGPPTVIFWAMVQIDGPAW